MLTFLIYNEILFHIDKEMLNGSIKMDKGNKDKVHKQA